MSTRQRGLELLLDICGCRVLRWVMIRRMLRSDVLEQRRRDGVDIGLGTPDASCAYFVCLPCPLSHAADSRAVDACDGWHLQRTPGTRGEQGREHEVRMGVHRSRDEIRWVL
jgi:hypothetical protein